MPYIRKYSHSNFINNHLGGFIGIMANIIKQSPKIAIQKPKKKWILKKISILYL